MLSLLPDIVAFPTVLFTVLLGVTLVYWTLVVLGAMDIDALGSADGAAALGKAGGEGAMEALAAKGHALDAVAAKGHAVEAMAAKGEAVEALAGKGHALDIFGALKLNRAPVTVTVSLFSVFGWTLSALGMRALSGLLPKWAAAPLVLVCASLLALFATSIAVRPLARFFVTHAATSRNDLVGKVGVVSTGRVDTRFGQARVESGGAEYILEVRTDGPALKGGARVLLVSWDPARETFAVEPLDPMLEPAPGPALADRARPAAEPRPPEPQGLEEETDAPPREARR